MLASVQVKSKCKYVYNYGSSFLNPITACGWDDDNAVSKNIGFKISNGKIVSKLALKLVFYASKSKSVQLPKRLWSRLLYTYA